MVRLCRKSGMEYIKIHILVSLGLLRLRLALGCLRLLRGRGLLRRCLRWLALGGSALRGRSLGGRSLRGRLLGFLFGLLSMAVSLLRGVWSIEDVWDGISLLEEVLNVVWIDLISLIHLSVAVVS